MKQLDVQIMGQSYLLSCPEEAQDQLMAAVSKVHEAMCKIQDAGKIKARDRIAVLAALNLAYEIPAASADTAALTSHSNTASAQHNNTNVASAAHIESLIARLDLALNADGQLL